MRLLGWVIQKRVDSYTTELDGGGEEKFERIVIYAPLLTFMLRAYLGGERLWRALGHNIDPHFRRLVTCAPVATAGKSKGGMAQKLFIGLIAVGLGAGAWHLYSRRATPSL